MRGVRRHHSDPAEGADGQQNNRGGQRSHDAAPFCFSPATMVSGARTGSGTIRSSTVSPARACNERLPDPRAGRACHLSRERVHRYTESLVAAEPSVECRARNTGRAEDLIFRRPRFGLGQGNQITHLFGRQATKCAIASHDLLLPYLPPAYDFGGGGSSVARSCDFARTAWIWARYRSPRSISAAVHAGP